MRKTILRFSTIANVVAETLTILYLLISNSLSFFLLIYQKIPPRQAPLSRGAHTPFMKLQRKGLTGILACDIRFSRSLAVILSGNTLYDLTINDDMPDSTAANLRQGTDEIVD